MASQPRHVSRPSSAVPIVRVRYGRRRWRGSWSRPSLRAMHIARNTALTHVGWSEWGSPAR